MKQMKKVMLITMTAGALLLGSVSVSAAQNTAGNPFCPQGRGPNYSTSRPQNPTECPYYDENRNCVNGDDCLGPGTCFRQTNTVKSPSLGAVEQTAFGNGANRGNGLQDGSGANRGNGLQDGSGANRGNGKRNGSGANHHGNGKHDSSGPRGQQGACRK